MNVGDPNNDIENKIYDFKNSPYYLVHNMVKNEISLQGKNSDNELDKIKKKNSSMKTA